MPWNLCLDEIVCLNHYICLFISTLEVQVFLGKCKYDSVSQSLQLALFCPVTQQVWCFLPDQWLLASQLASAVFPFLHKSEGQTGARRMSGIWKRPVLTELCDSSFSDGLRTSQNQLASMMIIATIYSDNGQQLCGISEFQRRHVKITVYGLRVDPIISIYDLSYKQAVVYNVQNEAQDQLETNWTN